jgi:hypothetical protein
VVSFIREPGESGVFFRDFIFSSSENIKKNESHDTQNLRNPKMAGRRGSFCARAASRSASRPPDGIRTLNEHGIPANKHVTLRWQA